MRLFKKLLSKKRVGRKPRRDGTQLRFESLENRQLMTVVLGDFNGDGYDDMVVADPYAEVSGEAQAGAVTVYYGSANGFDFSSGQQWHQDSPNVLDQAEQGDQFGAAVAAGDFNGDGFGDLAIGVAYEDVSGKVDAGAVNVLYGTAMGLQADNNQFWHEDCPNIMGMSLTGNLFGFALAVGDFDGDGHDDLAIGSPHHSYSSPDGTVHVPEAGTVHAIYGRQSAGLTDEDNQIWHQNHVGILDTVEAYDHF